MHVPSHVQNSFLRRANKVPFPSKVGLLKPIYTGEKYKGYIGQDNLLDYPILFFNNENIPLTYGQPVVFLPHLIDKIKAGDGKWKWLVMAKNIGEMEDNKKRQSTSDEQHHEQEEAEYKKTDSCKIIYCGVNPNDKAELKKSYEELEKLRKSKVDQKQRSNLVIEWIIENAISFDDMNLATN